MRFLRSYYQLESSESGQILLIMVLTLVVALTVGLSVASRALTNVKISKQNEESARAFQAAEAGVDQVLQQFTVTGGTGLDIQALDLGNSSQFDTSLTISEGTRFLVRGGNTVEQDIGADVQLADIVGPYRVTVYFGTPDQIDCSGGNPAAIRPALEVIVITNRNANPPTVRKKLIDPCGGRSNTVGTLSPDSGGLLITDSDVNRSQQFAHSVTFDGPVDAISNGYVMKVIPIYTSTKIGIDSSAPLPTQGNIVNSSGSSGDTVRTLQYFESLPEIPTELFQYAILSQ